MLCTDYSLVLCRIISFMITQITTTVRNSKMYSAFSSCSPPERPYDTFLFRNSNLIIFKLKDLFISFGFSFPGVLSPLIDRHQITLKRFVKRNIFSFYRSENRSVNVQPLYIHIMILQVSNVFSGLRFIDRDHQEMADTFRIILPGKQPADDAPPTGCSQDQYRYDQYDHALFHNHPSVTLSRCGTHSEGSADTTPAPGYRTRRGRCHRQ